MSIESNSLTSAAPSTAAERHDQLPVEIVAQMRLTAVEPITGVEIAVGHMSDGGWYPLVYGEGPSIFRTQESVVQWLDQERCSSLECIDGDVTEEDLDDCMSQTVARCLRDACEILRGTRPAILRLCVWLPTGTSEWMMAGQFVPRGATHLWDGRWIELGSRIAGWGGE